jgi:phosphoribosylformylglycinamidine synthase
VEGVDSVRQGKMFEVEVATDDPNRAQTLLKEACERLLANTVVENYSIEIL